MLSERRLEYRIEQEQRIAKANQSSFRFLQLSLQLFFQWGYSSFNFLMPFGKFMTYQKPESHFLVVREHQDDEFEPDNYTRVVQPICLCWMFYNLLLLLGIKCLNQMRKGSFILTGIINYAVALFIVAIGFVEGASDDDANRQIYHRYAPFQVLNCLIVVSLFYFTQAQEPRRFSTSPGNFVWAWLFLTWKWASDIEGYMLAIGLIYAIITTTSVATLLLQLAKGLTTSVKKILIAQLIFSLVLTGLTEIFAVASQQLISEIAEKQNSEMLQDDLAVNLLQIFIIVNILDMLFWIFGRCVTH